MIILSPCKSFECFLESVSAIYICRYGIFHVPSLLICNKLSNEWSAVFMGQLLLSELEKKFQKKLEDLGSNGH